MASKKKKSKKPSGLKITRNGMSFVCEWKIPSGDYGDGQQFSSSPGGSASIGAKATKKTVKLSASDYYPNTDKKGNNKPKLKSFSFKVRGNRDGKKDEYKWSNWESKKITINPPKKPSISVELTGENSCKLSWEVGSTDADKLYPFTKVKIQTKLVKNCTAKPEDVKWGSAENDESSHASGSKTQTESSATIADGTHTRMFRVKAIGPAGDSDWAYATHVYAAPNRPSQKTGENAKAISGGYDVKVEWNTTYNRARPIDSSTVEWAIAKPLRTMACPSTGVTWNPGATIKDTVGGEAVHITVPQRLDDDECLYTRVTTKHDSIITYGDAVLRKRGSLKAPTGLSVENVSQENRTAKITADNESTVDGAVLAIIFSKNSKTSIIGIIDDTPNYRTVVCPAWEDADTVKFGVRAVLPKSTKQETSDDGVTTYTIEGHMWSKTVWDGGTVAVAPSDVSAFMDGDNVRVSWKNNWDAANNIELSWSDYANAWESTENPDRYTIDNPFATSWLIIGLDPGKTWYVRVRSVQDNGENKTYSPYSEAAEINLSSTPGVPTLRLSAGAVAIGEPVTASWDYSSTDGTPQDEAYLYEVVDGEPVELTRTQTQEYADIEGWDTEGEKLVCVAVRSESGHVSEMSDVVAVTVAQPLEISMTNSLVDTEITDDDGTTRQIKCLTELPLDITVSGADENSTVTAAVVRSDSYHVDRPDEQENDGYKDETIAIVTAAGGAAISINTVDLIGSLDDGAPYRIAITVTDAVGQKATIEEDFEVNWTHKAGIPAALVYIDEEALSAVITPIAPSGAAETDWCEIYRISADAPELIIAEGAFGQKYVDPYPAFGESSGYRIVTRTAEGSYITANNEIAFFDTNEEGEELIKADKSILDFDGIRVRIELDMQITDKWDKDFTEKSFLGGSVRGYWGKAIRRSGSVNATVLTRDRELIENIRRMAVYAGECHVRTPNGSSYAANIEVSADQSGPSAAGLTLTLTRIESQAFEGMTFEEWTEGGL